MHDPAAPKTPSFSDDPQTLAFRLRLTALSSEPIESATHFFHIRRAARDEFGFDATIFGTRGDVVFANPYKAHVFADAFNTRRGLRAEEGIRPAEVNAMGLVHEVLHGVMAIYRTQTGKNAFEELQDTLRKSLGADLDKTLRGFVETFPPPSVYSGNETPALFLAGTTDGIPNTQWVLEELILIWVTNQNPGYAPIRVLISDEDLKKATAYPRLLESVAAFFADQPRIGPDNQTLIDLLLAPARHAPKSLPAQLDFMRHRWGMLLGGEGLWMKLLLGIDVVREEGNWFERGRSGRGDVVSDSAGPLTFAGQQEYEVEPEAFSADIDWMPRVVMMAKSTFVWLAQLSKQHDKSIETLRDIPDVELDALASRGFTALWLIGLWKRSSASQRIKQIHGAEDAVASAYSLFDYEIAPELGGWDAYENLRARCTRRGIRLASDMVPNHMGIDSAWVLNHPDWFVQSNEPPFPNYTFNGVDLSQDERVGIFLEDGYWNRTDAAVVFKRLDKLTGDVKYLYHGNDGTSMPWNDTAQLDYLKHEVREAVIQTILHVARLFPIIRFDAAMTLAKRHYQRLWFPLPGSGGDIPSRAQYALPKQKFDELFPVEFWREVVDRVAVEVPDTLLLAEAFWMMEGYFVRTLGMHRVYNSAFMHMLKKEENGNFRLSIKNVLEFNPQILKRYVNFMNNPDEESAVNQFGKDDKYFGVCTVMATMPGLPMFGHGQIEGFAEKYGMEFKRPKWDEKIDAHLVARHEREIFPLLRNRYRFSDVESFRLYDVYDAHGNVDEDVLAYSNAAKGDAHDRSLVIHHNKYREARGWIRGSVGWLDANGHMAHTTLAEALRLPDEATAGGRDLFVVFSDATTGHEHIRSCQELAQKGLYIELRAFEYHVYWQFRIVVSTDHSPYRDLSNELAGKGVPSIDEALIDRALRPIHASLYEAISPGSVRYLAAGWSKDEGTPTVEAEKALHEKLDNLEDGLRFMYGALSKTEPVHAALEERYARVLEWAGAAPKSVDTDYVVAVLHAWLYVAALDEAHALLKSPSLPGNAFDGWALTKVVERVLSAFGDKRARDGARLVKLALSTKLDVDLADPASFRRTVAAAFADRDGRAILGVNTYDGVTYFAKEGLETFVAVLDAFAAIEALDLPDEADATTTTKAPETRKAPAMPTTTQTASALLVASDASPVLASERDALSELAAESGYVVDAFVTKLRGTK